MIPGSLIVGIIPPFANANPEFEVFARPKWIPRPPREIGPNVLKVSFRRIMD